MNIRDYIKLEKESNERQHKIYLERNKDYADADDTLKNDWAPAIICALLDIDVRRGGEEPSWFRLIDKLCRDRVMPKRDNLDDAMNYIRRIMAWRAE